MTLVHHHYVGIIISPQLKPGMLHSDCDIDFSTDHMLVEIHQSHSRDPDPSGSQQEELRDISAKTRAILLDLFALGYGASTALAVLWRPAVCTVEAWEARNLKRDKKILDTWTRDGVVFVKTADNNIKAYTTERHWKAFTNNL